ncbi:MAG: hypothetical protein M5U07_05210 [Xanthobacteraceae bacterium]|nr:hypothetical protein [Xanthobacteraceae bacterium]PWB60258.1 MAG: hypothetical protein C3F17_14905 [Bradyrhizobiaceae bacterium]
MESARPTTLRYSHPQRGDNVLRMARSDEPLRAQDGLNLAGQATVDLLSQVAETVAATEVRAEALLVRAIEQLREAEERNRLLEARVLEAETRAKEAERWLRYVHAEIEEKFAAWRNARPRRTRAPAAA